MPIFDQANPKIIETTFCFLEFAPPCKKSVHSINSFLRYSQFQSPVTRLATPIQKFFDQLLIYMNLYQHAKNQAISLIFLEIWLIKNPTISLAENILAHISEARIFPNMGFVQEYNKYDKFSSQNKLHNYTNLMIQFQENAQTDGRIDGMLE